MKYNLDEYKSLLENIKELYNLYKSNPRDSQVYFMLREKLKLLDEMVSKRMLPSDLLYKTEKVVLDTYRKVEGLRKK